MQHRETGVASSSTDRLRKPVEQRAQHVVGGRAGLVQGAVHGVATGRVRRQPAPSDAVEQRVDDGGAARPDAVEERRLAGAGGVDGLRVDVELGGVLEHVDGRRPVAGTRRLHQQRATADVHGRSDAERQRELEHFQVSALDTASRNATGALQPFAYC